MPTRLVASGTFKKTRDKIKKMDVSKQINILRRYGQDGVDALSRYTPVDTGKTAASWYYTLDIQDGRAILSWENSNQTKMNIPVALLIQFGHATRDGYYLQGIDYINPALKPIFEKIAKDSWKEVVE